MNVAGKNKVTFTLMYDELLERRLGIYEHVVHVDPGQLVRDLRVEVNIHESRDITYLRVPPLRNDIMNAIIVQEGKHAVHFTTFGRFSHDFDRIVKIIYYYP